MLVTKKWNVRKSSPSHVTRLAEDLGLSTLTATVLFHRGFSEVELARQWLTQDRISLHDPFLMADMGRAVDRLHHAIERQEKICCYGDYDVDGISATSLYLSFLRPLGAVVGYYIPDRQREGYGLNEEAVCRLAKEGVKVLVTVDCGTSCHKEVRLAQELGLDVIITDHHQILGPHPEAFAFLNPQRADCRYPFKGLCSGGLAFKVASSYCSRYVDADVDVAALSDLAALATLADMVPLQDENRVLVRHGLNQMGDNARTGVDALKKSAGISGSVSEGMVAFRLAPMINAAGRLAHARLGVDLLTSESPQEALAVAQQLANLNNQRRELEQESVEEAIEMIDESVTPSALVVGSRRWHVGVVGIVASRLVERFARPAIVVAFNAQGFGRGSVRSVPGLDVCQLLTRCSDLLAGFGGHPAAAGIQIQETQFEAFQDRFSQITKVSLEDGGFTPSLDVDAPVALQQIQPRLLREFEQLQPFGVGNPEPVFLGQQVTVLEQRVLGKDHLKLIVRQGRSVPFECLGFRMGAIEPLRRLERRMIDMVFVPEINRWKGLDRIQLRIRDIKVRGQGRHLAC
ncbi:MAG: single-stranded-DNA-specific exonuclease RecJ [Nitrospirales bacterium]|nr:single-stranded-DNA-specific exonuclease RecJ [Nitrospira sp.]MDR4500407.1 single-stranded-DNA-specific exonuclease RecJ [Nitrospirales bacterium]